MTTDIVKLKNVGVTYKIRKSFFRHDYYTALKSVTFTVKMGETLGIVGVNGCGKSTLLRVLANIYGVDEGEITWYCKRVSLLSLSLGFDNDLSGRDNAIISGMLLGGRRQVVLGRIGEIIEFSELQKFIDMPLKTYSSGMRARLGFAVALTMQSELLLIDEALSVGDGKFRQKAEAAMAKKINSDQTVVLVSHSTEQIKKLCDRILWLHAGSVKLIGKPADVLGEYSRFINQKEAKTA